MTFGSELFHGANDFIHKAESAAAGAANNLFNDAYEGMTKVGHQVELFGEGVVTGAILNPINGVEQIVNNVAGTHLPALEFTNQKEVENSWAGKLGIIGGTVLDFVVTDGAAGAVMGVEAGSVGSLAVAGALQGAVFTPSDSSKTGGAFFLDRLENGAIDAATFATMGGVAGKFGEAIYEPGANLTTRMIESAVSNGFGGAAGGVVNAEGTAILKDGRLATKSEVDSAILTNGLMGAGFGAGTTTLEAAVGVARGPVKPGDDIRARLYRGYDNAEQVAGQIDVRSNVSQEFLNNIAGSIDRLPDNVRDLMVKEDLRATIGDRITNIDPSLKGVQPDGWKSGTWDNARGYYTPGDGAVISEYRLDNAGQLERPSNAQGVVRHEIGHGVDSALRPYTNNGTVMSMTPEFQDAWKTDIANLSPADMNKLEYFIQNSNPIPERGPDEAFAELFAVLNGGSTNTVGKSYIMRMFPRTTAVVAKSVPTNTP